MSLKTNIKQVINKLNRNEQTLIVKTLLKEDIPFTKNNNGYFFNLSQFTDDSIQLHQIYNTIVSIDNNRLQIKTIDDARNKVVNDYKKVIEENLKNTLCKKIEEYNFQITIIKEQVYTNLNIRIREIPIENKQYVFKKPEKPKVGSIEYKINEYLKLRKYKNKSSTIKYFTNDNFEECENNNNNNDTTEIEDYSLNVDDTDIQNDDILDLNDIESENLNEEDDNNSEINLEEEYYINLLKKNGIECNTDKSYRLLYEDYIV